MVVSFFLYMKLKEFFEVIKDDNKLLKYAYYDLHVKSFKWGWRALGLINKFVTGSSWPLLESDVHILYLNKHYQQMAKLFDELSMNSLEFMRVTFLFFLTKA